MKNKYILSGLLIIASFLFFSGCEFFFKQTGTLDILAYMESAGSYDEIAEYDNSGILYITPQVNGSNYLTTGPSGKRVLET